MVEGTPSAFLDRTQTILWRHYYGGHFPRQWLKLASHFSTNLTKLFSGMSHVEGVRESQQVLGVVWPNDGNMCTHHFVPTTLAWHIHRGSLAYDVLAMSPAFCQFETSLIDRYNYGGFNFLPGALFSTKNRSSGNNNNKKIKYSVESYNYSKLALCSSL